MPTDEYEQLRLFPETFLREEGPEPDEPGWWVIITDDVVWAKLRNKAAVGILLEGMCPEHITTTFVEWRPEP